MKKTDPLNECVMHAIDQYFNDLNGEQPNNMYSMFMSEVEKPFLDVVKQRVNGNQTLAAKILGINRNTLLRKLQLYNID